MESITLDAIDLQLLDLLQHDAAQSTARVAELLGQGGGR